MDVFEKYLQEAEIIPFKTPKSKEEYQKFVNDFYTLLEEYKLSYDKNLTNLFLNDLFAKNGGQ